MNQVAVQTVSGYVRGTTSRQVTRFTGIRYGELQGGTRFGPAIAVTDEARAQDTHTLPAVFPQFPSQLDPMMGGAVNEHPQEDDAFLLNISTPVGAKSLPVLVFLHGGSFMSGSRALR